MKSFTYIIYIILVLSIAGCKKFVDVGSPRDQLITKTVFKSNETANSAIAGLYVSMMSADLRLPFTIAEQTGMYSDELTYYGSAPQYLALFVNRLNSKDAVTNTIWNNAYKFIYQANGILEGLELSENVTDPVKNQLSGEALFLRAFWHFYLVNMYGEIPIVTSTDYYANASLPRQPVNSVYEAIITDLSKAKSLLVEKYVGGNSITETTERIRPNKYAASALLARVYLFIKNWKLAEEESTYVISNSSFEIESVENVFKDISKEAIWQIAMPTPVNYSTYEAYYFSLTSPPAQASQNNKAMSAALISKFSDSDLRRNNWVGVYVDQSGPSPVDYLYPLKYKNLGTTVDEHSIAIRLSEVYLIRAEARMEQNNLQQSINDTDQIRLRAGLELISKIKPNISKGDLLDSIIIERQRELFTEWGLRWLDLKRTGKASGIMTEIAQEKGGVWSDNWLVWPVPLTDINNNPKLKQNTGYN